MFSLQAIFPMGYETKHLTLLRFAALQNVKRSSSELTIKDFKSLGIRRWKHCSEEGTFSAFLLPEIHVCPRACGMEWQTRRKGKVISKSWRRRKTVGWLLCNPLWGLIACAQQPHWAVHKVCLCLPVGSVLWLSSLLSQKGWESLFCVSSPRASPSTAMLAQSTALLFSPFRTELGRTNRAGGQHRAPALSWLWGP